MNLTYSSLTKHWQQPLQGPIPLSQVLPFLYSLRPVRQAQEAKLGLDRQPFKTKNNLITLSWPHTTRTTHTRPHTCVTSPAIPLQSETSGAGTGGPTRVGQTQVTAAPIVPATAVDVCLYVVDLHCMDVHHTWQLVSDDDHVGAVFVGTLDSTGLHQSQGSLIFAQIW